MSTDPIMLILEMLPTSQVHGLEILYWGGQRRRQHGQRWQKWQISAIV